MRYESHMCVKSLSCICKSVLQTYRWRQGSWAIRQITKQSLQIKGTQTSIYHTGNKIPWYWCLQRLNTNVCFSSYYWIYPKILFQKGSEVNCQVIKHIPFFLKSKSMWSSWPHCDRNFSAISEAPKVSGTYIDLKEVSQPYVQVRLNSNKTCFLWFSTFTKRKL